MNDVSPGSMRVRLSITPAIQQRISDMAELTGLPDNQVAVFALSLGLRLMDVSFSPMSPSLDRAVASRFDADTAVREAVADAAPTSRRK